MIKQSVTRPGAFIVAYSKRHPLTGVPITLRRKNIESLKEAKRVEAELILAIEGKIRARIIPTWAALVENFLIEQRSRGFLLRTIENCGLCLKAHTFEAWSSTLIDEIQPQDIRQLVQRRVGEKSIGSQQSLVKFIRGAFRFAVESGYLKASPVQRFDSK